MKKMVSEFLRRGLTACGFGPVFLAVLYLILKRSIGLQTLTVDQVCVGIISLFVLAFVAGGMNAVYQVERLPLAVAILIHGGVLYLDYLLVYLLNSWLPRNAIGMFTVIFLAGYALVWLVIYLCIRHNTKRLNAKMKEV